MKITYTHRPWKQLWELAVTLAAIYTFGWGVLIPLILIQVDVKLKDQEEPKESVWSI